MTELAHNRSFPVGCRCRLLGGRIEAKTQLPTGGSLGRLVDIHHSVSKNLSYRKILHPVRSYKYSLYTPVPKFGTLSFYSMIMESFFLPFLHSCCEKLASWAAAHIALGKQTPCFSQVAPWQHKVRGLFFSVGEGHKLHDLVQSVQFSWAKHGEEDHPHFYCGPSTVFFQEDWIPLFSSLSSLFPLKITIKKKYSEVNGLLSTLYIFTYHGELYILLLAVFLLCFQ